MKKSAFQKPTPIELDNGLIVEYTSHVYSEFEENNIEFSNVYLPNGRNIMRIEKENGLTRVITCTKDLDFCLIKEKTFEEIIRGWSTQVIISMINNGEIK